MQSVDPLITRRGALAVAGTALGAAAVGGATVAAQSDGPRRDARRYRVTVANLTDYQPLTPPAVAAHRSSVEVWAAGEPANRATQSIAENGNPGPLLELIENTNAFRGAAMGETPIVPASDPGDTGLSHYQELHLEADASAHFMTFISMLIATNDGFAGLDTVPLPVRPNQSITYFAQGYDAGTERNTEQFADLVPPAQSLTGENRPDVDGTGESDPDLAEDGVITPHGGITGIGDVPEKFDWTEPAASVHVERLG